MKYVVSVFFPVYFFISPREWYAYFLPLHIKYKDKITISWVYTVNTRTVYHNGKYMFSASYAGVSDYKNNSEFECIKNKGTLPRGRYKISKPIGRHPTAGTYVLRLTPYADNNMCGRDGFLIHGDNGTATASNGCIVLKPNYRRDIAESGDSELVVR